MNVSDSTVRFRTRPSDRAKYQAIADECGMSMSAWIRAMCNRAAEGSVLDNATRRTLIIIRMQLHEVLDILPVGTAKSNVETTLGHITDRLGPS